MKLYSWSKWAHSNHGIKGPIIRRYRTVKGKRVWETYPKAKYKDLNPTEIEALLRRLNATAEAKELEARERYAYKFAYINTNTVDAFEKYLGTKANSREHIRKLVETLKIYTFEFFIHNQNLPDPSMWKRKEELFGHFLLEKKISPDYVQRIVQLTNRFISFLHNKFPDEVALTKLECVSNAVLKKQKEQNKVVREKYITDEHYKIICKKVNPEILPHIHLAYWFGLRRSEVLGLKLDDVYEDSLNVERQLVKVSPIRNYDLLKSKETRVVPYWNTTPDKTYEAIENMAILHPDTLGHLFTEEMKKLKLPYQFHDLRRTFITNALRKQHYRDVQLAAGHSQIKTTELYAQDDRKLQRRAFKPVKREAK